jgi:hypothetical protein
MLIDLYGVKKGLLDFLVRHAIQHRPMARFNADPRQRKARGLIMSEHSDRGAAKADSLRARPAFGVKRPAIQRALASFMS